MMVYITGDIVQPDGIRKQGLQWVNMVEAENYLMSNELDRIPDLLRAFLD